MLETNVLEKIIPEFGNLICKVEYDTYHEYTVDQHTLLMVASLDKILEEGHHDLYKIYRRVKNKFLLRLSFLLHDIGKSIPGDHSKNGAIIAARIGNRLGLNPRETDQIQFLIYNHLILSEFSFTHEWEKEGVKKISRQIKNKSNLDMLYLLTVMDIKNVGSKTWTGWKGIQLKELYTEIRKTLNWSRRKGGDKSEKKEKLQSYSFFDSDQHNYQLWINQFKKAEDKSILHLYSEDFIGFIRLTVVGQDRKNFFTDIVSCISSEGYNILSAKILSTEDGIALDIFHLEPDILTMLSTENRVNNIQRKWGMIQTGEKNAFQLIDDRLKNYPSPVSDRIKNEKSFILVNNKKSDTYTVLEVKTRDRFGLLFKIAQILNRFEINIISAKLSTRIDRVVDVFYINTLSGKKIEDPAVISSLEDTLKAQLI
jgi:[protein-PII] uridylyltransferase